MISGIRKVRTVIVAISCVLAVAQSAPAELDVRECIVGPSGSGAPRWKLPPDSEWYHIAFLDFNLEETSDAVLQASIGLAEGNTGGVEVEYQFTIDGQPTGFFVRRTSEDFPSRQRIQSITSSIAPGERTLGVRARNLGAVPVTYFSMWITPLFVPTAEETTTATGGSTLVVPTTWTTLESISFSVGTAKTVFLSSYFQISSVSGASSLSYRLVGDGATLVEFESDVPTTLRDGVHLGFIDASLSAGSKTYVLEARATTGSVTVGPRSVGAQAVPQVTVLDHEVEEAIFRGEGLPYSFGAGQFTALSSASIGTYGTDGYGFGHYVFEGSYPQEMLLQHSLTFRQSGAVFEVGVGHIHGPQGREDFEAMPTDWERLGLVSDGSEEYRIESLGIGLCSEPEPIQVKKARVQIAVLPDEGGFVAPYVCANAPQACCDQFSACTIYECRESGELPVVQSPGIDCGILPLDDPLLFRDDLETGDLSWWDDVVP